MLFKVTTVRINNVQKTKTNITNLKSVKDKQVHRGSELLKTFLGSQTQSKANEM